MRILYTYEYDFLDPHRQSGRPWQVRQALGAAGVTTSSISPTSLAMGPDHRLAAQAFWRMRGAQSSVAIESRGRLTLAAGRVQKAFAAEKCDIVVAPSTIPLAYASPGLPAIEVLDAFFRYNLDRYEQLLERDRTLQGGGARLRPTWRFPNRRAWSFRPPISRVR